MNPPDTELPSGVAPTWAPGEQDRLLTVYYAELRRIVDLLRLQTAAWGMASITRATLRAHCRNREALAITEAAMRRFPQRPRLNSEWVADTWSIGTTQANLNQMPAALTTLNKAFEPLRQLEAFDLDDNLIRRQRRAVENARAEVLSSLGRHAEAVKALETAIENSKRLAEGNPEDAFLARDYAITFMPLGVAYANAGRQREACSVWHQGRELLDCLRQRDRLNASDIKEHLGNLVSRLTNCP
jgi:tetratricopeptide (TPR) repeat protein